MSPAKLKRLMRRPDPLFRQIANYEKRPPRKGREPILARIDRPSAPIEPGRYLITDDHPLVEYPEAAARLVDLR